MHACYSKAIIVCKSYFNPSPYFFEFCQSKWITYHNHWVHFPSQFIDYISSYLHNGEKISCSCSRVLIIHFSLQIDLCIIRAFMFIAKFIKNMMCYAVLVRSKYFTSIGVEIIQKLLFSLILVNFRIVKIWAYFYSE